MPKILRIINRLNLGGPTYNVAYLSKYLDTDFETKLIAGQINKNEASARFITDNLGLEVQTVRHMYRHIHPYNDRLAYREIKNIIHDFKPDIVHTHAAKSGALGRLAAFHLKVPVIIHTFHGHVFNAYFNTVKTKAFLKIERFLARKTNVLIALSKQQKHELSYVYRIADEEKFKIIPLGFDLSKFQINTSLKRKAFRKRFNIEDHEISIAIVGRLTAIKNHKLLLRAIALLPKRQQQNLRVFVVGDGELMTELKNYCSQLLLRYSEGNSTEQKTLIMFTSWIKAIDELMAGVDIVTLSSDDEGTPVSLIEAQAAGKAIVSTNVGGIADIVDVGRNALLSQPGDVAAFAANLSTMIDHLSSFTQEAIKRIETIQQLFHYKRLVDDMAGLYRNLLSR